MISLGEITPYFTITSYFIVLILGTIGNVLNFIIFLSKDFRKKSCIFYMICSSSLDLIFINFGIIIRLSTDYFGNNINRMNPFVCKIRSHLIICLSAMASTCVFLATLDRCLSTSRNARCRQFASIQFAQRLFIITMIFLGISSLFYLIIFDIRNDICTTLPGFQTIITIVYGDTFISAIPHGGMLICAIFTWIHIRQSRSRIDPVAAASHQTPAAQRMNRQLLILIFAHAFISVIIEFERSTVFKYNSVTISVKKSFEQQEIENFITQLSIVFYYMKHSMPFYVNYACSTMFRKKFRKSIQLLMNRCCFCCVRD
ncbi:hypothetical protein I4U23_016708 [Adineta vaga]|nr:hypothetical protein I4U23_016708 [Adineta vaga]